MKIRGNYRGKSLGDYKLEILLLIGLCAFKVAFTIGLVALVLFILGLDITPEIMVVSGVLGYLIPTADKR